jgi:adhesin/invasin
MTGTGALSAPTAVTDAAGLASVSLTAPAAVGSATVTATAGLLIGNVVAVTYILDPNAPGSVTITSTPASTFVNQSVVITATVAPAGVGGVIADGTVVTFASTLGTFSAVTTTTGGVATATLNAGVTAGTASVTASAAGITSAALPVVIGAQPITAIVRLSTQGTLPPGITIGAINCVVNYTTTIGLSILDAGVTLSGTGVGSLFFPNTATAGQVQFALINAPTGITTIGEFVTMTFSIAAGNFPTAANFTLAAGDTVLSLQNNTQIVGVSVNPVFNVTIQ